MIGSILGLIGAGISGRGAVSANAKNRETKEELGYHYENLRQLADPVGAELEKGYAPGGWLRNAATARFRAPVEQRMGNTLQQARGDAWRYGGAGSGVAKRRWQDAQVGGALGFSDAEASGDAEAMDVLGRMDALKRGYKSAFAPETVYSNRYAWVGDATQGLNAGSASGPAGSVANSWRY